MLSQCANPRCAKPFLRLREGKLFLVETDLVTAAEETVAQSRLSPLLRKPPGRVERYWLCERCSATWTLIQNGHNGVALISLIQSPSGNREPLARHKETA